jgi:hypothetical protein
VPASGAELPKALRAALAALHAEAAWVQAAPTSGAGRRGRPPAARWRHRT